jgi:hypothetical protein
MRMMLRVTIPVEQGNKAIKDGSLPEIMKSALDNLRPEAAYFLPDSGIRTALIFFDLKDPSQIPVIAEPLFMGLNAAVEFVPVMNADDLRAGLENAAKRF